MSRVRIPSPAPLASPVSAALSRNIAAGASPTPCAGRRMPRTMGEGAIGGTTVLVTWPWARSTRRSTVGPSTRSRASRRRSAWRSSSRGKRGVAARAPSESASASCRPGRGHHRCSEGSCPLCSSRWSSTWRAASSAARSAPDQRCHSVGCMTESRRLPALEGGAVEGPTSEVSCLKRATASGRRLYQIHVPRRSPLTQPASRSTLRWCDRVGCVMPG